MVQDMVLEELDEDLFPLRGDNPSAPAGHLICALSAASRLRSETRAAARSPCAGEGSPSPRFARTAPL